MKKIIKFIYQCIWNIITILCQIFPDNLYGNKIRGAVLKPFFKSCGGNLQISKSTHIMYPYNISLGKDVFIGFNSWINGQGLLEIGDEVMLGPFVAISTGNHTRSPNCHNSFRFGQHELKSVEIAKGAWLGSHVSVMPGSRIGKGCIIAAGGVLVGNTQDCCLYTGVPARLKRNLNEKN